MKKKIELCMAVLVLLAAALLGRQGAKLVNSAKSESQERAYQVVIDVGHGGSDSGKVSADGILEKDVNLVIAKKLKGMPGHVNLIPLNDVVESPLKPSRRIAAFQKRLESHGLTATVRRSLGGDIDASCGQLRRKEMEEREKGGMEA